MVCSAISILLLKKLCWRSESVSQSVCSSMPARMDDDAHTEAGAAACAVAATVARLWHWLRSQCERSHVRVCICVCSCSWPSPVCFVLAESPEEGDPVVVSVTLAPSRTSHGLALSTRLLLVERGKPVGRALDTHIVSTGTSHNMDTTPGLEVYESYETDYKSIAHSIQAKLKGEAREAKGGAPDALQMVYNINPPAHVLKVSLWIS